MIRGEQIRAARALLRLNQSQLAGLAHVSPGTIRRLERTRGPIMRPPPLVEAVRTALENAGVIFIEAGRYVGDGGPGARLAGEVILEDQIVELDPSQAPSGENEMVAADASVNPAAVGNEGPRRPAKHE